MGKKKETKTGFLHDISEDQLKVLEEVKTWLHEELKVNNSIYDDWYLLRFCRARKFNLPDIKIMFTN